METLQQVENFCEPFDFKFKTPRKLVNLMYTSFISSFIFKPSINLLKMIDMDQRQVNRILYL